MPRSPAKIGPLSKLPDWTNYLTSGLNDASRELGRMMDTVIPSPILQQAGGAPGGQSYDHRDYSSHVTHQHHWAVNITSPEPLDESTIMRKQEHLMREMALEWGAGQ